MTVTDNGVTPMGGADDTAQAGSQAAEQTDVITGALQSSEKTEITGADGGHESEGSGEAGQGRQVPYEVFKRKNDELRQLQATVAELQAQRVGVSEGQPAANVDSELAEAERILLDRGFVRAEDVKKMVTSELADREFRARMVSEATQMEKKFDGSNGLPKFDRQAVAEWLDSREITPSQMGAMTLEDVYYQLNRDAIIDAKAKEKRGTAFAEKPGQPMSSTVDDKAAALEDAKRTGDFTNYIMKKVRSPFN